MRSSGRPTSRGGLATLLNTVWGPPRGRPRRRTPSSFPLRVEALESRLAPAADLAVTKVDSPDPVSRGDVLNYTITVENIGDSDATNAALQDAVPSGTTFVSFTAPAGWSSTTPAVGGTGTVSSTNPLVPKTTTAVFTLAVRVDPNNPGPNIANTASVTSPDDTNTSNDSDTEQTTVIGPDLALTKVDTPDPVVRGGQVTYTITVNNPGPGNALNVALTDVVPTSTTFFSFAAPAGFSNTTPAVGGTGTITSTATGPVAPGNSIFTLVVLVDPSTTGTLSNTATVVSLNDSNSANNSDTEQTTVIGPDLALTKADTPDPVVRGGDITYTITVSNPGPSNALNVALTDAVPTGTTFVSFTAPAGFSNTTPTVGGTGTITSTALALAPGDAVFTLVVRVDPSTSLTTISNTATVTSLDDPNALNNSDTEQTTVAGPDLAVTKTDTLDPVLRGGNITYTITVTNPGPGNALNVNLIDTVPLDTTFVSFTAPAGFNNTTPAVGATGTITSIATGPVGPGTHVFTLVVKVDPTTTSTTITNTAVVVSTDDPNSLNNSDAEQTTVIGPDLALTKTDTPDPVLRGNQVTYTITLTNPGPIDALNAVLTDVVPSGTTFVSFTSPAGFTDTLPAVGGTGLITSNAPSLLVPGTYVFTLVVLVGPNTVGPISNTATVNSVGDPNALNNSATQPTTVLGPDLALTKADTPDPVVRGGEITYTITVTNPGPGNAVNFVLTDVVPTNTTFVSFASPTGFTNDTPAVGATGTVTSTATGPVIPSTLVFTLIVKVDPSTPATAVNNTATVTSVDDPNSANNSATVPTTVIGPDLALTKTDTPDPVVRGGQVTYTITVTNPGPGNALNVNLIDVVPTNTTFVNFIAPAGFSSTTPAVGGTGTVTSTATGPVAPGSHVFTLIVTVDPSTPVPSISNTATVVSTDDPNALNNSATQPTTVIGPDLVLTKTKTAPPDPVVRGSQLTYTITVSNPGPGNALNFVLNDDVPTGSTFVSFAAPAGFNSTLPAVGGTGTITSTATGPVAPGNHVFTLIVLVGANTTGTLSNTATVTSLRDPNATNDSDTELTTVIGPDLVLTKTDTPDPVVRGDRVTYTIRVTNPGPGNALNFVLTDAVPAETTFVSFASPAGFTDTKPAVGAAGTVTSSATTPLGSGDYVFTLVVRVDPSTRALSISNKAEVKSLDDINSANDSETVPTRVIGPDLVLTKVDAPDPVIRGALLTYTITVTNPGPGNALHPDVPGLGFKLTDTVPTGATFDDFIVPAGFNKTTPAKGDTGTVISEAAGPVTPGTYVFTLVVQVGKSTIGTINNTATVTSLEDINTANDSATVGTKVEGPDLVLTKTDTPDPVERGGLITYTIRLFNPGPGNALNVALTDAIPENTTFTAFIAPKDFVNTTPLVGATGTITSNRALPLESGTYVFTLVVRVDATSLHPFVRNVANVTSLEESGGNSSNNTAEQETAANIPALPIATIEDAEGIFTVARFAYGPSFLPGDFRAFIDWGDGKASVGTVVKENNSTFLVLGKHEYTNELPHFPDRPFPFSVMVHQGTRQFDLNGLTTIQERPFPDGSRGTPEDRWLAEVQDNLDFPGKATINTDDARRRDFVNQWIAMLNEELTRTRNPRKARRNVIQRLITRALVRQFAIDVLGRQLPARLSAQDAANVIDELYFRYLEHRGRSSSWVEAFERLQRRNQTEDVIDSIRFPLIEFLSSEEFFNKTFR